MTHIRHSAALRRPGAWCSRRGRVRPALDHAAAQSFSLGPEAERLHRRTLATRARRGGAGHEGSRRGSRRGSRTATTRDRRVLVRSLSPGAVRGGCLRAAVGHGGAFLTLGSPAVADHPRQVQQHGAPPRAFHERAGRGPAGTRDQVVLPSRETARSSAPGRPSAGRHRERDARLAACGSVRWRAAGRRTPGSQAGGRLTPLAIPRDRPPTFLSSVPVRPVPWRLRLAHRARPGVGPVQPGPACPHPCRGALAVSFEGVGRRAAGSAACATAVARSAFSRSTAAVVAAPCWTPPGRCGPSVPARGLHGAVRHRLPPASGA